MSDLVTDIRSSDPKLFIQGSLLALAVLYTLYFARAIFIPIVFALLFNFLLSPLVRRLTKKHLPTGIGAALVLTVFLAIPIYAVYALSEPAAEWLSRTPINFETVERKLEPVQAPLEELAETTAIVESITSAGDENTTRVVMQQPGIIKQLFSNTTQFLAVCLLSIILLYFLLASDDLFLRKLVSSLPKLRDRKRAVEVAHRIEHDISRYLLTITAVNFALGAVTSLIMWQIGLPNPILWGTIAGLLNYIPYLGPVMTIGVLAAVSFLTFDDFITMSFAPLAFMIITTIEGQLLYPMVHGRRLLLNPVVIFVALIIWGWLWGIAGVFLAIPMLTVLRVVVQESQTLKPLAAFLDR